MASEFANFTVPTLKAFLKACSQSVSGNKQKFVLRATIMLPPKCIFPCTHDLLLP